MLPAAVAVLCLLPFLAKAFAIDDPLFLWVASRITDHPLDPLGFKINWTLTEQPISEITKNPPTISYAIAALTFLVGWSEVALHLAFLIAAVLVAVGTHQLARRMTASPEVASLAAVLTPVFLVCASGVTCDVPMLALWLFAVVLWHDGLEQQDMRRLVASMVLVSLCSLTKYFGMALIPLLAAYAMTRRIPAKRWAPCLGIPLVPLAGYQLWTASVYGRGLLLDAAAYATNWRAGEAIPLFDRGLIGLSFAGGCALTALTFAPVMWSRTALAIGAAVAAVGGALVGAHVTTVAADAKTMVGAQAAIFIAGGLSLVALAIEDWRRHRDAASTLLALWVLGTLVFASFINWTINGRSILPLVPAAGILIARRLELRGVASRSLRAVVPLVLSGLMALLVTHADATLANAQRSAALQAKELARGRAMWIEGHWGWQYYMQLQGARQLDVKAMAQQPGDAVCLAYNNTRVVGLPKNITGPTEHFQLPVHPWVSTMRQEAGGGFYASVFGPLPFAFGTIPDERYSLIEVKAK
jgi:hypothetical protein